jgi:DHA2 family multidrug resistance protein
MIPSALCTAIGMPMVGKMLGAGKNPKVIIIVGIVITFIFLMMMSNASPDSNQNDFYFPFVLRGFGLAFMMTPILSLAVAGLKGQDMAQGIGLANMIRQLGGAVGIAVINLYLTQENAENRVNMISYITDYGTASSERIAALTQNFVSKGYSFFDAQALAFKSMEGLLFKQQAMVSYVHGFFMVGLSILICVPIVFMIRYKKGAPAKVANDH